MSDATERLEALDAFRGATVAAMLLVNNPGSWATVYPPLLHAPWHGWTPTDLIFPFFLFIVGVTTHLSLGRQRERGVPRRHLAKKLARRALIIVLLGLFLSAFPFYGTGTLGGIDDPTMGERVLYRMQHMRFPGVLQRIGVAYLAAGAIWLVTGPRGRAAVTAAILMGYWALMTLVPVPGSGRRGLEVMDQPGATLDAWLDRAAFGPHLWVQSKTWDPEGLLSTLPAIATVLLGVFAGEIVARRAPLEARLRTLSTGGLAALVLGLLWGLAFPINKNLWTSSYALFTAGAAAVAIAASLWIVDARGWRRWSIPFVVFGVNPIVAFVGSGLMTKIVSSLVKVPYEGKLIPLQAAIYRSAFASWLPPRPASLAYALAFVLVWLAILWPLWRRRIFVKV